MFEPSSDCGWVKNPHLTVQEYTALETRVAEEKPHLSDALRRLKALLGEADFEKYINPLYNINQSGHKLLILAGSELRRSQIERACIPAIKEAFDVELVHVIGGR